MDEEEPNSLWTLKPPLHSSSHPRDKEPIEVQKLRKWQEERVNRRLRGDYESSVFKLSDLIASNLALPLRIADVRVEGANKTRASFLGFLINPLLPCNTGNPDTADLESVLYTTRSIGDVLKRTDIFHAVEARLERAKDVLSSPEAVDIVFKTREKGRLFLKTSTELGNNEGNASATVRLRNVFGGAEALEANMSLGTTTRKSFHASFSAPITADLETFAELTAFGLQKDLSGFASCSEALRGVKALVRRGDFPTGSHEIIYEAVLRNIGSLTPTASFSIREAAGQTTKSSFSYTYTLDTRDDRISATRGFYTKWTQELAGFGGDASFYKAEAENHISRPIMPGVFLSFSACSGLLWDIGRTSLFSDRFQLGGPLSVRSFRQNGLGPRDGSDSLGGDLYWSAGLSLVSDIPNKPHWPIKAHAFLNAGRLDRLDKSRSLLENVKRAVEQPSISAGVGLIYRFDPVRLEANFGLPLVANKTDGTRKGLQVGIGLEFL
ncbi:hypothetical protein E1B28_004076 [Marasmius oreades]|uniref:Bacterial surface antigen (D15) domain-containing protein n=1 Tax=Marasmius oreades TaxID=181124 RepID=A0A9P7UXW2_9AGAR|nr:uncharacterized protein E1B28_004076 [Marasmius oreades]KAG7096661.1 hypothetical protein E1B28_004076 [Marasmius oreades]